MIIHRGPPVALEVRGEVDLTVTPVLVCGDPVGVGVRDDPVAVGVPVGGFSGDPVGVDVRGDPIGVGVPVGGFTVCTTSSTLCEREPEPVGVTSN